MYSIDTNQYFISANATFFKDSSFFSSAEHPHVLDVLPSPALPSPSTNVLPQPLQVYIRHPHSLTGPSYVSLSSPAPVPQPSNDIPIALQKGTRSTSKTHLVYNFLIYHRLSSSYSTFVFTLFSISTPKRTCTKTREPLRDPEKYRRLVGKLNYLTITRSGISFPMSIFFFFFDQQKQIFYR